MAQTSHIAIDHNSNVKRPAATCNMFTTLSVLPGKGGGHMQLSNPIMITNLNGLSRKTTYNIISKLYGAALCIGHLYVPAKLQKPQFQLLK